MEEYRVYTGERNVFGLGSPPRQFGTFYIGYELDGQIVQERGRILVPCEETEYCNLIKGEWDYRVLRISAEKGGNTFARAELLERDAAPTPAEGAFLAQQALPVTLTDPQFGAFLLNKQLNYFEGALPHSGGQLRVSLDGPEDIETLRRMFADIDGFLAAAGRYAAARLLDLANDWGYDGWADGAAEGEVYTPLTAADFTGRITATDIGVSSGGSFTVWFDDGDLFWGHVICVEGSVDGGFTDASMQG